MKLRLTKTNKIVFALLIVVLSSALGFLVWRVNQYDDLAPIDSEAAGELGCPDNPDYVFILEPTLTSYGRAVCGDGCHSKPENCPPVQNFSIGDDVNNKILAGKYDLKGVVGRGHGQLGDNTQANQTSETFNIKIGGQTGPNVPDIHEPGQGHYIEAVQILGNFTLQEGENPVTMTSTAPSCPAGTTKNPNSVHLYKICLYAVQECGDGKLDSGEECDPPGSSCTKEGLDGTCSEICECSVNPYCGDGKLDANEQCEDGDPSGVQCTWSACNQDTCTCLTAGLNISKSVVERCIGDGTEDPVSELTYTVRVQNTGAGVGRVSKIEDDLDSKVSSSPSGITSPGQYSSGKILWDYTSSPLEIAANSTKTFTYKLSIDKSKFGTYSNTVTLTPIEGDTLKATASISADCEIAEPQTPPPPEPPPPPPGEPQPEETIPETGIFDSTLGRVGVGILLVIFGYIVYIIPNRTIHLLGKHPNKRVRSKFEQKVLKKDS